VGQGRDRLVVDDGAETAARVTAGRRGPSGGHPDGRATSATAAASSVGSTGLTM
jgi:hypothetical protein